MKVVLDVFCLIAENGSTQKRTLLKMDGSPSNLSAQIPQPGDLITLPILNGAIETQYQVYEVLSRNFHPSDFETRIEVGVRLYDQAKGFGFGLNDIHLVEKSGD